MKPSNLPKYVNGFLFSPQKSNYKPIENWSSHEISEFVLHCSPESACDYVIDKSCFLLIVGRALHLNDGGNISTIKNKLYKSLSKSENDFLDSLDELNGRFAIIFRGIDGIVKILNDACGMRSVFYSKGVINTFSSHPSLLADFIKSTKNNYGQFLRDYSSYHLPGNVTTYDDVFQLIPNHYLDSRTKRLTRFFPRQELALTENINKTRKKLASDLAQQISMLNSEHDLLCSISAGIDSRVTLAATRELSKDIDYFTYYGSKGQSQKILSVDHNVVSDIAFNLNLNHEFFELPSSHSPQAIELQNHFLTESHITHQASIALEYISRYRHKKYLHIRSNLLEIGRAYYRGNHNIKSEKLSIENAVLCYSEKARNDSVVISLFEDFLNEVSYEDIPLGYDPFDLFYWEYRMGVWHSLVILESDRAFDTHILFNSRKFLKELLSIPHGIRKDNNFYLAMCSDNWPILSNWGINNENHAISSFERSIHTSPNAISLEKSIFLSGTTRGATSPKFNYIKKKFSAIFNLTDSAPCKDDYVSLITTIDISTDKTLVINVRTPFSNSKLSGRMGIVIELNGNDIWTKDVSEWKENHQIVYDIKPGHHILKITSIALRDCEPWSWGQAGSVIVERLSLF